MRRHAAHRQEAATGRRKARQEPETPIDAKYGVIAIMCTWASNLPMATRPMRALGHPKAQSRK